MLMGVGALMGFVVLSLLCCVLLGSLARPPPRRRVVRVRVPDHEDIVVYLDGRAQLAGARQPLAAQVSSPAQPVSLNLDVGGGRQRRRVHGD